MFHSASDDVVVWFGCWLLGRLILVVVFLMLFKIWEEWCTVCIYMLIKHLFPLWTHRHTHNHRLLCITNIYMPFHHYFVQQLKIGNS